MIQIQIGQEKKDYPEGTAWKQVAEEYQKFYENDILLVNVNGKLQELHKGIREGRVKFITAADKPGMSAYQRSATLMMLKAFYEIVGAERIQKVSVDFSIGKGFFVDPEGDFQVTPQLLAQVKEKMKEYAEAAIPIYKRSVGTDDAVEEFRRHRMYDKARLFAYRRVSRVNLYSLEGFEDYYYGYMVQNTSYIRYFDLIPYHQGFVMLLPQMSSPRTLPQFIPQEKLFSVLEESSQWGKQMDLENVGALNDRIASGQMQRLILVQEALQEKKISEIAQQIGERKDVKFIMIAGPSSSGKTTFAHRLSVQLEAIGLKPHAISVDNYFVIGTTAPGMKRGIIISKRWNAWTWNCLTRI